MDKINKIEDVDKRNGIEINFNFNNRIIIRNEEVNWIKTMGSIGSFFGAMFAVWKVFNIFLLNKYKNLQAKHVMKFDL